MVLPLMIVDNEIYRYLPSIVVSTIDKMAMLGTSNDFKMLFGQVKKNARYMDLREMQNALARHAADMCFKT